MKRVAMRKGRGSKIVQICVTSFMDEYLSHNQTKISLDKNNQNATNNLAPEKLFKHLRHESGPDPDRKKTQNSEHRRISAT